MNIKELVKSLLSGLRGSVVFAKTKTVATADLVAQSLLEASIDFKNKYVFECFDALGNLRWREVVYNQVTTEGVNDLLTQYFKGSAYTAAFYVGLVDNTGFTAYAAGDTAAKITTTTPTGGTNSWQESTAYSNANRQTLTLGTPASGSVDNSASKAVFNINATATILGAFVVTTNTKGGTTGKLFGAASFTGGSRAVQNGDTLNVTVTLSAS
jgi:hypothetical protein